MPYVVVKRMRTGRIAEEYRVTLDASGTLTSNLPPPIWKIISKGILAVDSMPIEGIPDTVMPTEPMRFLQNLQYFFTGYHVASSPIFEGSDADQKQARRLRESVEPHDSTVTSSPIAHRKEGTMTIRKGKILLATPKRDIEKATFVDMDGTRSKFETRRCSACGNAREVSRRQMRVLDKHGRLLDVVNYALHADATAALRRPCRHRKKQTAAARHEGV
jgi:hypothetical protein